MTCSENSKISPSRPSTTCFRKSKFTFESSFIYSTLKMEIRCIIPHDQQIFHHRDCSSFNICLVYRELRGYLTAEKFEIIKYVWKPVDVEY